MFATILLASLGATQTIELYRARYRPAAVLVPIARNALGSEGQVTLDARTATLVLNGSPQAIQRALALLEQVDLPLRQVVIESVVRDRYGAPLDTRWMAGAWSSHFEFRQELLRVRTDVFTRPPRISQADLARIWQEQAGRNIPFLDPPDLAEMKKTNRERDYAVIGELARLMEDVELQIRYSRSARDLLSLANQHAERIERIAETRPALRSVAKGRDELEVALDAERRESIRRHEARLEAYAHAASRWYSLWPSVAEEISDLPLTEAHNVVVTRADGVLPRTVDVAKAHNMAGYKQLGDEFLSEKDLSLGALKQDELFAYWDFWLLQAQATNDLDEHGYSHGVFEKEPV